MRLANPIFPFSSFVHALQAPLITRRAAHLHIRRREWQFTMDEPRFAILRATCTLSHLIHTDLDPIRIEDRKWNTFNFVVRLFTEQLSLLSQVLDILDL